MVWENHLEKSDPKNHKIVEIKMKMPHAKIKPQARKRIFVHHFLTILLN